VNDDTTTSIEVVKRLTRETVAKAKTLGTAEVRCLVDFYYASQEDRKRANSQLTALMEAGEPNVLIVWLAEHSHTMERQIHRALDAYTDEKPVGRWCKSNYGVGPVITAGLLAHIDIEKAPTVGHIWRFGGVDPTDKWGKGEKRPWNASLKTLFWKIGDCWTKFHNHPECYYGHIYAERKDYEIKRNDAGGNAQAAKELLETGRFSKSTAAYAAYTKGRLPDGQIERRAQRYATKWFLGDLHTVWYWIRYGRLAPQPWVITHGGHAHYELYPVFDSIPELKAALKKSPGAIVVEKKSKTPKKASARKPKR
jgi:hypothetical protein